MVIACDLDNQHSGLALLGGEPGREEVLDVRRVVMGGDPYEAIMRRVAPVVIGWLEQQPTARLLIERPPGKVSASLQHGPQAVIGEAQGWVAGVLAGAVGARLAAAPVRVPNGTWHDTLALVAARRGVSLPTEARRGAGPPPELVRVGAELRLRWACGHDRPFNPAQAASAPQSCPSCAKAPADARRDLRKQRAWTLAQALAPELMARVAAEASAKARGEREPWRLAGVDDVADAVGVGLHGLNAKLDTSPSGTGVACA